MSTTHTACQFEPLFQSTANLKLCKWVDLLTWVFSHHVSLVFSDCEQLKLWKNIWMVNAIFELNICSRPYFYILQLDQHSSSTKAQFLKKHVISDNQMFSLNKLNCKVCIYYLFSFRKKACIFGAWHCMSFHFSYFPLLSSHSTQ